jgi:DinB superfamily
MKRLIIALTLVLLAGPALRAQDITKEERDQAVKYLEKTRAGVLEATKGLSAAQWNYKPATNRWSVAECMEHIAAAEDFIMGTVRTNVMTAPARTEAVDLKALDEAVLKNVPDRTTKIQAPEPLVPSNRFGTPQASLKHFEASRAKTIAFVKETKDLRGHAIDSPLGKKLDAYEWVLLIAAHSERHTKQIEEVKADPGFPKK